MNIENTKRALSYFMRGPMSDKPTIMFNYKATTEDIMTGLPTGIIITKEGNVTPLSNLPSYYPMNPPFTTTPLQDVINNRAAANNPPRLSSKYNRSMVDYITNSNHNSINSPLPLYDIPADAMIEYINPLNATTFYVSVNEVYYVKSAAEVISIVDNHNDMDFDDMLKQVYNNEAQCVLMDTRDMRVVFRRLRANKDIVKEVAMATYTRLVVRAANQDMSLACMLDPEDSKKLSALGKQRVDLVVQDIIDEIEEFSKALKEIKVNE